MTIAFYLVATIASAAPAEPFDAHARIEQAIAIIRPVAYRSRYVKWKALARDMRRRVIGARDDVDMLPAWAALARGLGDRHSFIQPTDAARTAWQARYGTKRYLPDDDPPRRLTSTFTKRTGIAQTTLPIGQNHIALLVTVTPVSGFGAEAKGYATTLFSAIADASPRTCGYIVDLRGNTGGNVWPMLLGLSGLLGDGSQGVSQDAKGKIEAYAALKQGTAVVLAEEGRGATMLAIDGWRSIPALQRAPVAILVDDATASSGEGVAVAFAGRPATRTFGSRTYGVASSNEGFRLPDGTNVVVTTGMMMDRSHRSYSNGIMPDEAVSGEVAPVEAAQRWLMTQTGCGKG